MIFEKATCQTCLLKKYFMIFIDFTRIFTFEIFCTDNFRSTWVVRIIWDENILNNCLKKEKKSPCKKQVLKAKWNHDSLITGTDPMICTIICYLLGKGCCVQINGLFWEKTQKQCTPSSALTSLPIHWVSSTLTSLHAFRPTKVHLWWDILTNMGLMMWSVAAADPFLHFEVSSDGSGTQNLGFGVLEDPLNASCTRFFSSFFMEKWKN